MALLILPFPPSLPSSSSPPLPPSPPLPLLPSLLHRTDVLMPTNASSSSVNVTSYVARSNGQSSRLNAWLGVDLARTTLIFISWLIMLYTSSVDRMEGKHININLLAVLASG